MDNTNNITPPPTPETKPKQKGFFNNVFVIFFFAIVTSVIFRSALFEPFIIPSGSMRPGLIEGDHIIVSKYAYGWSKYSFPFAMAPIEGKIWEKSPKHADVVIFKLPENTKINYIKRVVGLPGDKIHVVDGVLYINDKKVQVERTEDFFDPNVEYFDEESFEQAIMNNPENEHQILEDDYLSNQVPQYIEQINQSKKYNTISTNDNSLADNTIVYQVPDNHYFVLGDNRDNSYDSRFIEGNFIHKDYIVGQAQRVLFSNTTSIFKIFQWHTTLITDRFWKKII